MNNRVLLQAMALDLKRVALGYHSGSIKMAEKFTAETVKRSFLLDKNTLPLAIHKTVNNIQNPDSNSNTQKLADDALMFSNILLSYSR